MQVYSEPSRESDAYALPDVEVFYLDAQQTVEWRDGDGNPLPQGWYWWSCFPGCLPDGEPSGPFKTATSARRAAQSH
jgi:hypothetical protein